ncbi:MAG TPA: hypothetical protein VN963_07540 [bacterium]|nr:hypothetical protein [bacterium]
MKTFFGYLVLVLALGIFGGLNLAWADGGNPSDYLHSRTYVGVVGTSISVDNTGLFSGQNYSVANTPVYDLSLIPAISQGFGWGVLVGHREEVYALEVSFWQSTHNATFGPGVISSGYGSPTTFATSYAGTAVYSSINVDFKRYFLTELQFQPFLDLGVSYPWITIGNADIDASGNLWPLTLEGLGFNVGVGAEYYINTDISIIAGAYQRWSSFGQFTGSQTANTLSLYGTNPSEEGSGLNFAVGTTLGFE